jgi:hypothetical protein
MEQLVLAKGMTMNNLEKASPQTSIEKVMSNSSDKKETMHLTTPRSTQGSNEENLTLNEHGSIDYVRMKVSLYRSHMHEKGTRYYIKSRNMQIGNFMEREAYVQRFGEKN